MPVDRTPEAERVGQALLDLSARLPEGFHDLGGPEHGRAQAGLVVSYDAGAERWEVEFTPLDPARNRLRVGEDLGDVLVAILEEDRKVAPDV